MKSNSRKNSNRLPEFIIAGGMKCGTTSLHHILDSHPDVFIPKSEIHFFNIDDILQNSDFFAFVDGVWQYPKFERNYRDNFTWYQSFFRNARDCQLIGEDSTTYLASENAPKRISELISEVKIIIMLRDPTHRTYSNYWHMVRTGRALWNFENSLQIAPFDLIQRSLYKSQIERFMRFIPYNQIYFILFEEFISDIPSTVKDLCKFLGISFELFDFNKIDTHLNRATIPAAPNLQLWMNRILQSKNRKKRFLNKVETDSKLRNQISNPVKIANKIYKLFNPLKMGAPPPMNSATKKFLDDFFRENNNGLSEIVGKDINGYWYKT